MHPEDPFVVMCQRYPSQVFIHTHSLNYFTAFMLWEIDTVGMKTNLKQLLEYFFYITPYIVSAWVTSRTEGRNKQLYYYICWHVAEDPPTNAIAVSS